MTVSLIRWALWSYDCQSDALGFVVVWSLINLRPSLYLLVDSIQPQSLNEAGFYSEQASIRGNIVNILMSVCPYYPHECTCTLHLHAGLLDEFVAADTQWLYIETGVLYLH